MTSRLMRSTNVPTDERHMAPFVRSPSQWPGTMRAATSGGRKLMLVMLVMLGRPPLRAVPSMRGSRVLWLLRSGPISSVRSVFRGMA